VCTLDSKSLLNRSDKKNESDIFECSELANRV